MEDLFRGIAIVIDDEVQEPNKNISRILNQIEASGIPLLKYNSIPDKQIVDHLQNLSFLILDWQLRESEITEENIVDGVKTPAELESNDISETIDFLKSLIKSCFCPIFIFTNENVESIKTCLTDEGITGKNIFVMSKQALQDDGSLFQFLGNWIKETPSIYVLKEWDKEYQKCKNKLFSDFHELSSRWPYIIWKNFEDDGANKSLELGELISRNLHSRMTPFEFDSSLLEGSYDDASREELRKVLQGERYLEHQNLHDDDIGTGDLFKEPYEDNGETKYRYFLNIRAQCDLVRNSNPMLYCLKGRIYGEESITRQHLAQGQFIEKICNAIIPFVDNGVIIEILFHELMTKRWNSCKTKRIGRVLPPHITRIQQKYSLYMQRQGLPRLPDASIFEGETQVHLEPEEA